MEHINPSDVYYIFKADGEAHIEISIEGYSKNLMKTLKGVKSTYREAEEFKEELENEEVGGS